MAAPTWLNDAVLYQIYPQSFADSTVTASATSRPRGTPGVPGLARGHAVWLNPCFVSPLRDAGYDVADYLTTSPLATETATTWPPSPVRRVAWGSGPARSGAGHTSDTHPWFQAVRRRPGRSPLHLASPDPTAGCRTRFIALPRQPARLLPAELLRLSARAELRLRPPQGGRALAAPRRRRRPPGQPRGAAGDHGYWLARGLSGFRVDMAASLVKDDPARRNRLAVAGAARLAGHARTRTPHCCPSGATRQFRPAGFHADFFLQFGGPTNGRRCARCGATALGRSTRNRAADPRATSTPTAGVDAATSSTPGGQAARRDRRRRAISLPTANHDFSRLCCGPRTAEQLPPAFAFQLTWPDPARDLLRRRDRHALRPRPSGPRGQRARPRLQPGRVTYPDAMGRHAQRRVLRRPGRPASTCRSTPTRAAPTVAAQRADRTPS